MRVHQSETVAIVGAGPYGLSLAAHLGTLGIPYHVFGQPMRPWRDNMPPGMLLKSDGESSSLSDPDRDFPIERFYKDMGQPFHAQAPIPVETFIAYGQAFQRRFVPTVDTREVVAIAHDDPGFVVRTADGDLIRAGKVVLAVGIAPFSYLPPALSELPPDLVTHASAYGPVSDFRGRAVAVVGSGASAIDLAIALHGHGADVQIVSRHREIPFQAEPSGGHPACCPGFFGRAPASARAGSSSSVPSCRVASRPCQSARGSGWHRPISARRLAGSRVTACWATFQCSIA